jgi:hypothetical protein
MSSHDMDKFRKEMLVVIDEILQAEHSLREKGAEVADLGEWQQLTDIVKRIERKLAQG